MADKTSEKNQSIEQFEDVQPDKQDLEDTAQEKRLTQILVK